MNKAQCTAGGEKLQNWDDQVKGTKFLKSHIHWKPAHTRALFFCLLASSDSAATRTVKPAAKITNTHHKVWANNNCTLRPAVQPPHREHRVKASAKLWLLPCPCIAASHRNTSLEAITTVGQEFGRPTGSTPQTRLRGNDCSGKSLPL